jgi:hypothetical protein
MASPQVETSVRSLSRLHKVGSTARVLDLLQVVENAQFDNAPIEKPLFSHPTLNRCFIIKHRLRRNETEIFDDGRTTATKILIPIDVANLEVGGRYIFVGQRSYLEILGEATGVDILQRPLDMQALETLDRLPSFDPFLLREWLARSGVQPDSRYFELSLADIARMESSVLEDISRLVAMSLIGLPHTDGITRLVRKLLSSQPDREMQPIHGILKLDEAVFREGLFSWKGLLCYRWRAKALGEAIAPVLREMRDRQPLRGVDSDAQLMLEASRRRLGRAMVATFNGLADAILDYERTYAALSARQDPLAFRSFLLDAPGRFLQLGDGVGQLEHIIQFWRHRTLNLDAGHIPFDEYADLLRDFEEGLTLRLS